MAGAVGLSKSTGKLKVLAGKICLPEELNYRVKHWCTASTTYRATDLAPMHKCSVHIRDNLATLENDIARAGQGRAIWMVDSGIDARWVEKPNLIKTRAQPINAIVTGSIRHGIRLWLTEVAIVVISI